MKADNVVTIECSVEMVHAVKSASSSHLGLKPSKFIGLVPCHLMPAENKMSKQVLTSERSRRIEAGWNTCTQVKWRLHNMHARARKNRHPIRWCLWQP